MKKSHRDLRLGMVCGALLLAGCAHQPRTTEAQAAANSAVGTKGDSALTGEPASKKGAHVYPRATLVSLPPAAKPISKTAPVAEGNSVTGLTPPSEPAPAPTPPPDLPPSPAPLLATSPAMSLSDQPPSTSTPALSDSSMPKPVGDAPSPVVATDTPPPPPRVETSHVPVVVMETSLGKIVIQLDDVSAPRTCGNFRRLVSEGYYNSTVFHRVIPNFIIQGGDPNSKAMDRATFGQGGPGYVLPAEIKLKNERGAVAMARLPDSVNPDRESNGSQFYICVAACPSLDNTYTVFAHVIKGMEVADQIANQPKDARGNPLARIEIKAHMESKADAMNDGAVPTP